MDMVKDVYDVRSVLAEEGRPEPLRVAPDLSVIEFLDILRETKDEAAVVMEGERFLGIVTENDYARKVELEAKAATRIKVAEIMTPAKKVIRVSVFKSLEEVATLMKDNHFRHVPAMEGEKFLGLISIWDVLEGIVRRQLFLAQYFFEPPGGPT